jgi:hypothetical protein
VVKELASLKSWHDTTKGESLFLSAWNHGGIWAALDKTEEDVSGLGKKTGLMNRIRLEMDKQYPKFYMEIHCIIHQLGQVTLWGKNFEVWMCYESCSCELHSIS